MPVFHYLTVKNIFVISSLKVPSFSLKPFPLVLPQQTLLISLTLLSMVSLWIQKKYAQKDEGELSG